MVLDRKRCFYARSQPDSADLPVVRYDAAVEFSYDYVHIKLAQHVHLVGQEFP